MKSKRKEKREKKLKMNERIFLKKKVLPLK